MWGPEGHVGLSEDHVELFEGHVRSSEGHVEVLMARSLPLNPLLLIIIDFG